MISDVMKLGNEDYLLRNHTSSCILGFTDEMLFPIYLISLPEPIQIICLAPQSENQPTRDQDKPKPIACLGAHQLCPSIPYKFTS